MEESTALKEALPSAELIVMDYPQGSQLTAHGLIAKDLFELDNEMTRRLITFVGGAKP